MVTGTVQLRPDLLDPARPPTVDTVVAQVAADRARPVREGSRSSGPPPSSPPR